MAVNGTNGHSASPKITLYTNHRCPYAHRAQIALKELGLPFEEVVIDLDTPRPDWYLKINPRGLVPAIKYSDGALNEEVVFESAIVSQFLADSNPSHLQPVPDSAKAALARSQQAFFSDTFSNKVHSSLFSIMRAPTDEAQEAEAAKAVAAVEKEIEPLLHDAAPFFGGSSQFTMAEVMTAPFVIRLWRLSELGLLPKSLHQGLTKLPNFNRWATAVVKRESVTYVWDEHMIVESHKKRIAKARAAAAAAAA